MKVFLTMLFYQLGVGLFIILMWGFVPHEIGILRWLAGWVVGIQLLVNQDKILGLINKPPDI